MNSYTHMTIGGLVGGVLVVDSLAKGRFGFSVVGQEIYPLVAIIPSILSATGPDADMEHSKPGRIVRKVLVYGMTVFGVVVLCLGCINAILGRNINSILMPSIAFVGCALLMFFITIAKHRRETHCGLIPLGILLSFFFFTYNSPVEFMTGVSASVIFGVWCGWLSHLVADSFNEKGVPWLYPFTDKHFHVASVLTGSHEEVIFRNISIVCFSVLYVFILVWGR